MNIARQLPLFVLISILFATVGCETTGQHVQWYSGPPKETNKIALLKVQRDGWTVTLTVDKIDGQPLAKGKFMGNNTAKIELLPGLHDLDVSYRDDNDNRSTSDDRISFVAEAGKTYELRGAPLERSFTKDLLQSLTFQHWYWTVWIIDTKTQKVVAGTARETPLHWYE
jgi:hypothetical protein